MLRRLGAPRACAWQPALLGSKPALPQTPCLRPPGPPTTSRRTPSTPTRRLYNYSPRDPRPRAAHGASAAPPPPPGLGRRVVRSPSTRAVAVLAVAAAIAFYLAHLEVVPVSGRRRFNCVSDAVVRKTADMQHRRVLADLERQGVRFLPAGDARARLVERVMSRLVPVSGMADEPWEVHLIDDPRTANAFVLPGGKVFVFSGLFPLARGEAALAAVLGHEVAHNLAGHIGERMSAALGENILLGSLMLLSLATPGTWLAVTFLGELALDLAFGRPMGRKQEAEADYIGLMMMAEACYEPRAAVGFWQRMNQAQQVQPPEWASTHPSVSGDSGPGRGSGAKGRFIATDDEDRIKAG